jgi:hypothetical protein
LDAKQIRFGSHLNRLGVHDLLIKSHAGEVLAALRSIFNAPELMLARRRRHDVDVKEVKLTRALDGPVHVGADDAISPGGQH